MQFNRRDFLRQSTLAGLAIAGSLPDVGWAVLGDQLHIRNYNDITFLDPAFALSGADSLIIRAIFQGLLQFKTDGTWDTELDAAEYFEAVDDTHYAFRLKRGQMFNHGFGEMTADDVPDWDSLQHINLIIAVEKEFGISFATSEIGGLKGADQNVGKFILLIETKLGGGHAAS